MFCDVLFFLDENFSNLKIQEESLNSLLGAMNGSHQTMRLIVLSSKTSTDEVLKFKKLIQQCRHPHQWIDRQGSTFQSLKEEAIQASLTQGSPLLF
jgi:hypothetical protein